MARPLKGAASVILVLCGCVLLGGLPSLRASDDLFTQIYNRSIDKQRAIKSIRARFTETTTSSLLAKPIVAHGSLVAAPPGRVRMTYEDPEPKVIAMDGRTLVIAWPGRHERQEIDVREVQKRVDHYFRDASVGELQSMFEIVAAPDGTLRGADRIAMTPKRKQIKQGLENLELWVDRGTDMLAQMRMTFPGGDQKTIRLENVETNVPVSDADFEAPK